MDKMKIYVFGFAHSGTTILRKVIGDHSLVDEVTDEIYYPPPYRTKPHIVFKFSDIPNHHHDDCKRVMIIKNPWDVLASIQKREEQPMPDGMVGAYYRWAEYYLKETDDFKVRYEDLFTGGLESVFKYLGLNYEGPKERKSEFTFVKDSHLQSDKLKRLAELRTRQINSPFENMTGRSAVSINKYLIGLIGQHPITEEIYSDYKYLAQLYENRR